LLETASRAGVVGGSIYDALIAATARHAGATLLTRDQRALSVYEQIGVRHELV
jgi:predicted nucleic acid-binding protein